MRFTRRMYLRLGQPAPLHPPASHTTVRHAWRIALWHGVSICSKVASWRRPPSVVAHHFSSIMACLRCSGRAIRALVLLWSTAAVAHMEMSWPYALHSKFNPANDYTAIDYSMTSPLSADGSNFPCKGYQNDRPFAPVVTYVAGSTYNLTLAGTATHVGHATDGSTC